jgi:hypothetical protein
MQIMHVAKFPNPQKKNWVGGWGDFNKSATWLIGEGAN